MLCKANFDKANFDLNSSPPGSEADSRLLIHRSALEM